MKTRVIIIMVLLVLFTVFVSQNTEFLSINFFFWKFEISKIVLLTIVGMLGVIVGFILAAIFNMPAKSEIKNTNNNGDLMM